MIIWVLCHTRHVLWNDGSSMIIFIATHIFAETVGHLGGVVDRARIHLQQWRVLRSSDIQPVESGHQLGNVKPAVDTFEVTVGPESDMYVM